MLPELLGIVAFASAGGWLLNDFWQRHLVKIHETEQVQKAAWVDFVKACGVETYDWQVAVVNREIQGEYARRLQLFDGSAHGWPFTV